MATKTTVIKIKVHFELNTPNGLRRVIFGLEKDTTTGNVVIWKIDFQLFERAKKTDPFGDAIVTLNVEVDKALQDKAEKASKGLTPGQSAHALGPAADDAKAAAEGEIEKDEAKTTVQNTLKKK
jgi:flavin-dependent dehydrogenase